jgi:Ser/Thr protein kinase RdoA (MazF antagonist)
MLEQSDIAHYLLSLGLVKPRDVTEEGLEVVDASRRNCVFITTTSAGQTYVVKQAGPRAARTLAHEAAILGALAGAPPIVAHVPSVIRHDAQAALLVLSTPGRARNWNDDRGHFPLTQARALGRVLAALHQLPAEGVQDLPAGYERMWGLSLTEPSHELLLVLSAGAQDLLARLQANAALCERLEELRASNTDGAFVHGDLRRDNCLAVTPPGSRRATRLLLVDWELGGRGVAEFDVGTVLAGYLGIWVGSIPIVDPADPGRLVARARRPLGRMQPAMHAFWSEYRLASPQQPALSHVIELAAVQLLQTAVENAQSLVRASSHTITLVQLAEYMLWQPDNVALNLLGLHR